jgi:outer membrane biosynthesis protein TonB
MTAIAYRVVTLPWTPTAEDEQRFKRIFRDTAIVLLILGVVIPWLPIPEILRERPPEVPVRYAKLMLEKKAPPPPPPVIQEVVQETVAPEPEPLAAEPEARPDPVPAPAPREAARERAAKAGVMAFADSLADLRENDALAAVSDDRSLTAGEAAGAHNQRALITSRSGTASGGINTAGLSRNTGGGELAGRSQTQVASSIGGGGGGGAEAGSGTGGEGRMAARSREEIEMIFDQNKGAIYALYSRALRKNPALRGKLVLRLTIAPDGAVTDCEVVSSELNEPAFERRLVARVKMFRFEDKDVAIVTTTKPIDFFPA